MRRAVVLGVMAVVLAGCSTGDPESAAVAPSASEEATPTATATPTPTEAKVTYMQVVGDLTVDGGYYYDDTNDACFVDGGYSDIHIGTQVVVTDAASETLALGELEYAEMDRSDVLRHCVFSFTVDRVPRDEPFYGIEIADRGRLQYTEDDLKRTLHLELG